MVLKQAAVLGATGSVGRRLVELLSQSKHFTRVLLLGRRTIELPDGSDKFEQHIVNFDEIEKYGHLFKDVDTVFCAMGATSNASKEVFYKVDHDYIINTATIAKENGVSEFLLVSAVNANPSSSMRVFRIKGETEREVTALGFNKLIITRPFFMHGPREKEMRGGAFSQALIKGMMCVGDSLAMTTAEQAKALIHGSLSDIKGVVIWSNADCRKQAKDYDSNQSSTTD